MPRWSRRAFFTECVARNVGGDGPDTGLCPSMAAGGQPRTPVVIVEVARAELRLRSSSRSFADARFDDAGRGRSRGSARSEPALAALNAGADGTWWPWNRRSRPTWRGPWPPPSRSRADAAAAANPPGATDRARGRARTGRAQTRPRVEETLRQTDQRSAAAQPRSGPADVQARHAASPADEIRTRLARAAKTHRAPVSVAVRRRARGAGGGPFADQLSRRGVRAHGEPGAAQSRDSPLAG